MKLLRCGLAGMIVLLLIFSFGRRWISSGFANLGAIELVRASAAESPDVSVKAYQLLQQSHAFAGDQWLHSDLLWYWYSSQGQCEDAVGLISASMGTLREFSLAEARAGSNPQLALCLLRQYQALGMLDAADLVRRQLHEFPVNYVSDSRARDSALRVAIQLMNDGIWTERTVYRLISAVFSIDPNRPLPANLLGWLLERNPTEPEPYYWAALSAAFQDQDAQAHKYFEKAQILSSANPGRCTLDNVLDPLSLRSSATNDKRVLFHDGFEYLAATGQPAGWDWNAGWVGGPTFEDALFWWMIDQHYFVEGKQSLKISGIWENIVADGSRENARAGFYASHRPIYLNGGQGYQLSLKYRTLGLPDGQASIQLQAQGETAYLWGLPGTAGCWQEFTSTFTPKSDQETRFLIRVGSVGDAWFDDIMVQKADLVGHKQRDYSNDCGLAIDPNAGFVSRRDSLIGQ